MAARAVTETERLLAIERAARWVSGHAEECLCHQEYTEYCDCGYTDLETALALTAQKDTAQCHTE
jgi:hypothetical protein